MRRLTFPEPAARLLLSAGCALLGGCQAQVPPAAPVAGEDEIFADVTAASGIDFVHDHGGTGELYFHEIAGAGAAFLDFDGDGDLDLYLVQGGGGDSSDRLYRNDGTPSGGLRFTDVTESSGLRSAGYGMGVATGDVDNDGFVDLYVTNWGRNRLWRNRGDGTFTEVTDAATGDERWSTSAAFLDFDRDGWLDLYVVNYVDFRIANHVPCRSASGHPDYCGPQNYEPQPDRLLRNRGDGSFEDVSGTAGILREARRGLGIVATDADRDGWLDLYVANDRQVNLLWLNRGGRFENQAVVRGCAVNGEGMEEASMGVDAADLDGDGDEDLFVSHLRAETNTAYLNDGAGFFQDRSAALRLAGPSLAATGFGTAVFDFDNDGGLDVAVVNGAVRRMEDLARAGDAHPYGQPNQLFRKLADGGWEEVPAALAGAAFARPEVSRGLALGDVDNDGDADLLIANNHGPPRLLINTVGQDRPWIGLRLVGTAGRRDMLGASAALVLASGAVRSARARTDASYCSARDPRVLFAVPEADPVREVRVDWPDGSREAFEPPEPGRYTTLVQGTAPARGDPGP